MDSSEVERQIGDGAFSDTFLMTSKASGKRYVLKKIWTESKERMERAIKEAIILKGLVHPHIVRHRKCYTALPDEGEATRVFIEMEYCENGDLANVIANRNGIRFKESQLLIWFKQLCSAVKYIHDLNVLHRDLKPKNIFLESDNNMKIGDFGIATILENTFTQASTLSGTYEYLAPELWTAKPYDQKCDIWSLGCIFYELISLEKAFPQSAINAGRSMAQRTVPVPSGCPKYMEIIVGIMLKYEPSERATIEEVNKELEKTPPPKLPPKLQPAGDTSRLTIVCDGCDVEVGNIRYKCLQCRDHYLCKACAQQEKHTEHALLRTCGDITKNWHHGADIQCDACFNKPIIGLRFRCLQCSDYNLCEICFSGQRHPFHRFSVVCEPLL